MASALALAAVLAVVPSGRVGAAVAEARAPETRTGWQWVALPTVRVPVPPGWVVTPDVGNHRIGLFTDPGAPVYIFMGARLGGQREAGAAEWAAAAGRQAAGWLSGQIRQVGAIEVYNEGDQAVWLVTFRSTGDPRLVRAAYLAGGAGHAELVAVGRPWAMPGGPRLAAILLGIQLPWVGPDGAA